MKAAARPVDFNRPDTARMVGGELAATTHELSQRMRDWTVSDVPALSQAVTDRQTLALAIKAVETFFAPLKKMAYDLHRALCAREQEILGPLQRIDDAKRRAITDFKAVQDQQRRDHERRLADEQRRENDARAAAEATNLERSGEHAMAAAVRAEAAQAPTPVIVLPDVTKAVEGLKFRRRFLWRYTGGPAEVRLTPPEIIAHTLATMPREYLCIDEAKLSMLARTMKGTAVIPGIEFYHLDEPVR